MELRKNLILWGPQSGRLEGRTRIIIQLSTDAHRLPGYIAQTGRTSIVP